MVRKVVGAMLVWTLCAVSVPAAPCLVPENGVYAEYSAPEYEIALARALLLSRYREVQLVSIPAFSPEEAVYVERDTLGGLRVVHARMKKSLHQELARRLTKPDGSQSWSSQAQARALKSIVPTVEVRYASITAETYSALKGLWAAALACPRPPLSPGFATMDGVEYHLADWTRGVGYLSGLIRSPASSSWFGGVVQIGEQMAALTGVSESGRHLADHSLLEQVLALTSGIQSACTCGPADRGK